MKIKQIGVTIAVVAIIFCLYRLPIKGLIAPKIEKGTGTVAQTDQRPAANITVDMVSATAKTVIGEGPSAKITGLEGKLKSAASDADKLSLQKQLAQAWSDVNQPAPAAFYYQAIARQENTAQDWINAGNHFNDAYKLTQDTTAQPVFDANAVEAFQNAAKLQPENLDAKAGLGIAYVNGGGAPMQGIGLLLDVVKQDPNNKNALLNLGMFAMKSGQFDKAVDRFKTLITVEQQKPEVEPYFYLAESYKQLGMRKEAIDAYQKCIALMPDPAFDQKIEEYIKELQN
jgi:tetratricopeptide (TPR) repeat protein